MAQRALLGGKLKATGIHLSLSLVAFGGVLYFILAKWYPPPWFSIDGGWQGVRIMVWVDLVLGPALTFLVYNPGKSRRALAFDFSVIGILQAAAFTWGVYAVHGQRPAAISYWDSGLWDPAFYSIEERALHQQGRRVEDLAGFDHRTPPLIFAEQPTDQKEIVRVADRAKAERLMEYEQFDLLRPLKPRLDAVFEDSEPIGAAVAKLPDGARAIERALKARPDLKREDLRFAIFDGRYETVTLIFDRQGEILGFAPYVDPDLSTAKAPTEKN